MRIVTGFCCFTAWVFYRPRRLLNQPTEYTENEVVRSRAYNIGQHISSEIRLALPPNYVKLQVLFAQVFLVRLIASLVSPTNLAVLLYGRFLIH